MKMTRNADSLACTCLGIPGTALLKIVKPITKETREVRAIFCAVSVFFVPCTCRPRRHSRIASRGLDCDDVEGYRPSRCMFVMKQNTARTSRVSFVLGLTIFKRALPGNLRQVQASESALRVIFMVLHKVSKFTKKAVTDVNLPEGSSPSFRSRSSL